MGGMAGVGVAPPPNHPPTSLAGGSTRARHPGPSIARARCGGKRYPGCLSVPLPPKSPDFHPRQSPPNRPVPHRQVRRCSGKAHSRARTAAAAALARSLDRARSLWRLPFVAFGYTARHAHTRARVRHQRASRASSPFSVPPPRTHARAATALACSLARSRARARAVRLRCGRSHRPSRALRAPRVTRALAYVITAHRARHRRFPSPRARPARAPCSGGGAHSRTLDCARAVWRW